MLLLPFEKLELPSALPPDEILKRVAAIIEPNPPQIPFFYRGDKYCTGMVDGNRFGLQRIIRYRNNFLPAVVGEVRPEGKGSRIKIELRLAGASLFLWLLLLAVALFGAVAIIAGQFSRPDMKLMLVALLLPAFAYLLCMLPFNMEAVKAKKILDWVAVPPVDEGKS